jgi:hypothetical protein
MANPPSSQIEKNKNNKIHWVVGLVNNIVHEIRGKK